MSEPSPEAKQAAANIHDLHLALWEVGGIKLGEVSNIIQQAIDTATAKLREELDQTRENLYAGLDRDRDDITTPHLATVAVNALALAREELELAQKRAGAWMRLYCNGKLPTEANAAFHAEMQLAHQQPSAPTADVPPQGRDTADVEKIARELAEGLFGEYDQVLARKKVLAALAQARAPLVAALRFYADSPRNNDGGYRARIALGMEK